MLSTRHPSPPASPGPADAATTAVVVSHAGSGELRVFHLSATGELTPGPCLQPGGQLMPLALGAGRRFLYAARRSVPLEVLSFSVRPSDGRLDAIGAAALPESMAGLATDRRGRFLFSVSYGGGVVAVGPIDVDGVARGVQQVIATPPKPHAIAADPTNRHVLVSSLGGGALLRFDFDPDTGRLSPDRPVPWAPRPDASPRHFVFSADGGFVYVLGELDAQVDVLAFDPATGALRALQTVSALPPGFRGTPWAADLHLTPDGRLLVASERRSGTLAAFAVAPGTGLLRACGHVPTEAEPRGFQVAPDGRHLVVAGQASAHLAVHPVDASTGVGRPTARVPTGDGPNWIECIPLPGRGPAR